MLDFDVRRTTRRCSSTERPLQPGEVFYSVLLREGNEFSRQDFCAEAWSGPPEECVGWWRCRIPKVDAGRVFWAPNDVLVSYFEHLIHLTEMAATGYVMTLVMVRRRLLEIIDTRRAEGDTEWLVVRMRKTQQTYEVPVIRLDDRQIQAIQRDLAEQLFTDQPPAEI